jgi:hypothetical protein
MTELELYKFIEESLSLTSFDGEEAIIWVYHHHIGDFVTLIGDYYLSEGGIEVRLQEEYIAVKMNEICEYNDINMFAVFSNDNN